MQSIRRAGQAWLEALSSSFERFGVRECWYDFRDTDSDMIRINLLIQEMARLGSVDIFLTLTHTSALQYIQARLFDIPE